MTEAAEGFTPEETQAFEAMREETSGKTPVIETEAAPEPKPEPVAEQAKVETEAEKPEKQNFVPQQALHEERKTRQELQREFEQYKSQTEERLRQIAERINPPQQPPSVDEDPIGALKATQAELQQFREFAQQQQQESQARQQIQTIATRAAALEREFVTKTPDYNEASAHLIQSRDAELQMLGMADPMQRQQTIQMETMALANMAIQNNQNPAELVYTLARQRGFTPKQAEAAAQAVNPEAEKLNRIAEGQQAGQSLGSATGSPPPAEVSAKVLANMSDEEFDKFLSALPASKQREYLGG